MKRKILTLSSVLLLALQVLLSPQNAYSLNSPEKISTSTNNAFAPAITTDSNGKVHLVWMDGGWETATNSLLHSFWNGNVWSTPTVIASGGNFHELPSLAADNLGNVYLTWDASTNPDAWQIYYSKYSGASWSVPVAISSSAVGDTAWESQIALDSSGNPHVVYSFIPQNDPPQVSHIFYTKWNGTSWTSPTELSSPNTYSVYPAIAADSAGKVHVAWKRLQLAISPSTIDSLEFQHRVFDGISFSLVTSISAMINLSRGHPNESHPRIAVDKNNNAHAIWQEEDSTTLLFKVMYSKWNGTTWSAPFTITNTSAQSNTGIPYIGVVSDSANNIYVGWVDKSTTPFKVGFRRFNNLANAWEPAQTANTSTTSAEFPVYAVDKFDNVHIAWLENNSSTSKHELFYDVVPVAVKVIGSSGGSLSTTNGDTMTIPSGSLSSNTTISMQIAPLTFTAPTGFSALPRQYIFEPFGTTFNPPIEVVFKYSDAEFSGPAEKNLGIYVWDSTLNQFVFKTGTINKVQNTVTITLDHFSIFSILSAPDTVDWKKPLVEEGENLEKIGRTVPIKFFFTEPVTDPTLVKVQIIDNSANVIKEFTSGTGSNNLRFDPDTRLYITNLETKNLATGDYQIKVLYQNLLKASLDFSLQ